MKRMMNYFCFVCILSFMLIINCNAECSYQERKDLLNDAKKVDIYVEPYEVSQKEGVYDFKFNIVGLSSNLYVKYYNSNNGKDFFVNYKDLNGGIYSFVDSDSFSVYQYTFSLRSNKENCLGYEVLTKKVKKPMYNLYSTNVNCDNDFFKDFLYCQTFLEKDYNLTKEKFNEELVEYSVSKKTSEVLEEEKDYTLYYVYGGISLFVVLLIIAFILIKRKRSEL